MTRSSRPLWFGVVLAQNLQRASSVALSCSEQAVHLRLVYPPHSPRDFQGLPLGLSRLQEPGGAVAPGATGRAVRKVLSVVELAGRLRPQRAEGLERRKTQQGAPGAQAWA